MVAAQVRSRSVCDIVLSVAQSHWDAFFGGRAGQHEEVQVRLFDANANGQAPPFGPGETHTGGPSLTTARPALKLETRKRANGETRGRKRFLPQTNPERLGKTRGDAITKQQS